jgi:drug/metabolite transporter (DMT)-like permease
MPDKTRGYLTLASATLFWGLSGALSKYFFNQSLSPLVLVTVRLTLSGLPG